MTPQRRRTSFPPGTQPIADTDPTPPDYLQALLDGKLSASENLDDLDDAEIARVNLGLGTAATRDAGGEDDNLVIHKGGPAQPFSIPVYDDDKNLEPSGFYPSDFALPAWINNKCGVHLDAAGEVVISGGVALGLNDFTLALKLKMDDYTPANAVEVWSSHSSGNSRVVLSIQTDGAWRLTFTDSAGIATDYDLAPSAALTGGYPYMVAVVCDRDGNARLYVNGASAANVDISAESDVDIGDANANNSEWFTDANSAVTLYSLSLYDEVLTSGDVTDLYRDGSLPGGSVLAGYRLDEGIGYQIRDISANHYDGLLSTGGFTWLCPRKSGSVRGFGLDANGAVAYLLSGARDILPNLSNITHVVVNNNDNGAITAANFQLNRYDGINSNTFLTGTYNIASFQGAVFLPTANQIRTDLRIQIPDNSDAGMDNFDLEVFYVIIN